MVEYEYFDLLKTKLQETYACASEARSKGLDPTKEVEIKIAKDVAARVEGIVGPPGISEIIRNMEKNGMNREMIAFEIARQIASGHITKGTKEQLIEQAVRTGVGILTEGVLVAPTEGIAKVKIKNNPDGTEHVAVYYSGPIRSAGGTAAALSVVLADIARRSAGISDYRATDTQIERYVEEVNIYEARVAHLQYKPPDDDVRLVTKNCPICIDGDPTEDVEVSVYRNVAGVETNRIRGGIPLVVCEGIAQKAAKLFKYTKKLELGWDWLEKIIKVKRKADTVEIKPDFTYLEGLVAGRPVFAYPSRKGGFRLRYGRSRTTGIMAKNIHPATMVLLDGFLAYGTHMKIERPGKGCVVTGCETIDPPIVKLKNGDVLKVRTVEKAGEVMDKIQEILFLGDMLVPYGDFVKTNHPLLPSGWCEEWWLKELESKGIQPLESAKTDAKESFEFSIKHGTHLHPNFTFCWENLKPEELKLLANWIAEGAITKEGEKIKELRLTQNNPDHKRILEEIFVEHTIAGNNEIVLSGENATAILLTLGMFKNGNICKSNISTTVYSAEEQIQKTLEKISGIKIKPYAPTYIGARMGRPEKAKERAMDGKPNVLFPTGSQKNRSITKIYRTLKGRQGEKTVLLELSRLKCKNCGRINFSTKCEICNEESELQKICQKCNSIVESDIHCDLKTVCFDKRPVEIVELIEEIKKKLGIMPDDIKGVKGLSNPTKIPECLEKGFLRAKHEVYVFRDGTSRFDATDVPLTHFIPKEIGLSLEKAKELGYEQDYLGNPLESDAQLVPLKHQDVILSDSGTEYFLKVAKFIDEMLINFYGMQPFYNIEEREELIGHMAAGLSPHTSAAVLCRIIGTTRANVGYAHPYFHTAKRRNCFSGKERIPIMDKNGKWKLEEIERVVESELNNREVRHDDFGTEYCSTKSLKTITFNPKTMKYEVKEINAVSRHRAPENMVEIKTAKGRKIIVTPDHPMINGMLEKTTALELKDALIPIKVDIPEKDIKLFDVSSFSKEVMVRSKKDLFAGIELKKIAYENMIKYKTLTNYRYRRSYPIELLNKIGIRVDKKLPVAAKRDTVWVKRFVNVDNDFNFLLGYYLAEGYARKKDKNCYQVCFTATKKEFKTALIKKIKKVFGIDASETGNQIVICSRIIYEFFKGIGITTGAKNKELPSFALGLPKSKIKALLNGLFCGDGSVSLSSTIEVNLTSISKRMIEDVSFVLCRFGIMHSIFEDKRYVKSNIILKFYGKPKYSHGYKIRIYGNNAERFITKIGFSRAKQKKAIKLLEKWKTKSRSSRGTKKGDAVIDRVVSKKLYKNNEPYVYSLTVKPHHTVVVSGVTAFQCDGDEDCLILLMDALINFSKKYLSETRGGTMDTPLVLTSAVDPKEVDDEVHCMELGTSYPLELYTAAEKIVFPGDVKIKTIKDVLGTPEQYDQIPITHYSESIDRGVIRTAYVQLDSIPDKITTQFKLQERIRAVDQKDAAERLILSHFIPDLYGNLRSFSRQTFRCVNCNEIYRRVPLAGKCNRCGGNLLLTINKGGIKKYLEISRKIVNDYELPDYLKQRLELLDREIKSIFEDEKIKQMGLSDFI